MPTFKHFKTASLLLGLVMFVACQKSPTGPALKALGKTYTKSTFHTEVYTESMIRTAIEAAKMDSAQWLSFHTEYFMVHALEKKNRRFNLKVDTNVRTAIADADLQLFGTYQKGLQNWEVYARSTEQTIDNVVVIMQDTAEYKVYEFVGDMPKNQFVHFAIKNYQDIENMFQPKAKIDADPRATNP